MSSYPPQRYPQAGSQFSQPGYQSGPPQYPQAGPQYSQPGYQQGMQQVAQPVVDERKSWTTTFFLCVLLGSLGAHRFYTGKIGTGLLMLFTLGGLGIWRLVDFIMIITGGFTDKNGMPLVRIIKSQGPVQGKDWQVAMLLCIFLGVVGMHRFYVGKNGTAIAMLLTGGGFGIWWLIDLLLLVFDNFTATNDVPLLKRFVTVIR